MHVGMKLKKARKQKVEIKTQKNTNLVHKDGGEERQEEYPISVPLIPSSMWNRYGVLFLSLFTIFLGGLTEKLYLLAYLYMIYVAYFRVEGFWMSLMVMYTQGI